MVVQRESPKLVSELSTALTEIDGKCLRVRELQHLRAKLHMPPGDCESQKYILQLLTGRSLASDAAMDASTRRFCVRDDHSILLSEWFLVLERTTTMLH